MICISLPSLGQTTQVEFGKNRVQFKEFDWSYYDTEHFSIYFYLGGQDLGKYVIEAAENNLKYVESKLEYFINNRIQVIVYNNFTDLRQSNIGIGLNIFNTGGVTKIVGDKIFIYFNGDHAHLERQLREGIAKIFINEMMYGGNLQEAVQNAVLLNLPDWFIDGLVSYIGREWDTELDNKLRDGIVSGKYKKFTRLTGIDAKFAGHSMWYYISEKYGSSAVPNLLYLTRINRSLESGFLFVFGKTLKESVIDWYTFYSTRIFSYEYLISMPDEERVIISKPRRNLIYHNPRLNPNGTDIAYVTNKIGRYKIKVRNKETGKSKTLLRGGYKTHEYKPDLSFPLLTWSPSGNQLAYCYVKRDKIYIIFYDTRSKEKRKVYLPQFQKVLSLSYAGSSNKLVLSAMNKGQSDIYMMNTKSYKVEKITTDLADDLNPRYIKIKDKEGILFVSNRVDDVLTKNKVDTLTPMQGFDIFFFNYKTKSKQLIRITNTPSVSEDMPMQYDDVHFAYLSDGNGIRNRYAAYFDSVFSHFDTVVYFTDSTVTNPTLTKDALIDVPNDSIVSYDVKKVYKDIAISFPITNFSRSIMDQDISLTTGTSLELIINKGRYYFYENKLLDDLAGSSIEELPNTPFRNSVNELLEKINSEDLDNLNLNETADTTDENEYNYYFQTELEAEETEDIDDVQSETEEDPLPQFNPTTVTYTNQNKDFEFSKVKPYRVALSTDYVISQLDNSQIFTKYQNFAGGGQVYNSPSLNPLINIAISDLFEDYRFVGGFRLPTNLNGSEYFLSFEDLKFRLDKKISFYRKSDQLSYDMQPAWFLAVNARQRIHYLEGRLKWPINEVMSLRGYGGYRNDNYTFLASDTFSMNLSRYTENWISSKIEFVYDNTIPLALNLLDGTRLNIFFEAQKQVDTLSANPIGARPKQSHFFIIGGDIRHYLKIHRELIWANRLSFASSFGPKKLVYYLGGTDNWLFPKFNHDTPIDLTEGYAFQSLATNLRGFDQNIRNGSSYVVINSEIRMSIFKYLNIPLTGNFWRNFQVIAFGDVGTAWKGRSPYDDNSPVIISQKPIVVKVNYFRNPIVEGYGFGLRSTFLGYFVRFDVAWGVEDAFVNSADYFVSLGLDF
ncbi:MAG: hypothetical protein IIA45_12080 [Bacteroidetes bacterium]|nr:hypothetical protein [Bacteroidota bacterium]